MSWMIMLACGSSTMTFRSDGVLRLEVDHGIQTRIFGDTLEFAGKEQSGRFILPPPGRHALCDHNYSASHGPAEFVRRRFGCFGRQSTGLMRVRMQVGLLVVILALAPSLFVAQSTPARLIELRLRTGNTGVDSATAFAALKRGLERDSTVRVLDAAPPFQRAFENAEFVLYASGAMTRGLYFNVYAEDTIKNRRLSLATGRVGRDSVVAALEALGISMASRLVRDAGWYKLPAKQGQEGRKVPLLPQVGPHLGSPAGPSLAFGVLYTRDDLFRVDELRGPFASIEPGFRWGRASIGHAYMKFDGIPVGRSLRESFLRKYCGSAQRSYLGVEAQFILALVSVRAGVFRPLRGAGRVLLSWDVGLGLL